MDLKSRPAPPPPQGRSPSGLDRTQSERTTSSATNSSSSRVQTILARSQSSAVTQLATPNDRIKGLDARAIANALAHTSLYVRQPLLSDVNASQCNRFAIVRALIDILAKKEDMLPYQSVSAAFSSLAGIDLSSRSSSMPSALHDALVEIFVNYLVDQDDTHVKDAVEVASQMALRTHVALRLLDWLDQNCQSPNVHRALRALKLIDLATPEIIVRILSTMHHFSPSSFLRLDGGSSDPSCLDASAEILHQFADISYNVKVLETIDNLLKKPPVYATKNHAPTQRRKYIVVLLALLETKYAARIKKFQQTQQVW